VDTPAGTPRSRRLWSVAGLAAVAAFALSACGSSDSLEGGGSTNDGGGDSSTIQFVEVAFPDVKAQLEAGNIDAGWVPDPFRGLIVSGGGVDVVSPYQATIPGLTVLTNFTTQEKIDADPQLVADYAAAMAEAQQYATDNEDAVRAAIVKKLEIPEAAAASITLPNFTSDLDDAGIEKLAALAVQYKYIDAEPDFTKLIQPQ